MSTDARRKFFPLIPVRNPTSLSNRERQVAALVSTGASNQQIAAMLGTAEQTIKNHLHTVFKKLGIRTRTELALAVRGQPEIVAAPPPESKRYWTKHPKMVRNMLKSLRPTQAQIATATNGK